MAIINNIEQLKQTVKINSSSSWDNLYIFLTDARDHYLLPYLGLDLLAKLESIDELNAPDSDRIYVDLLPMARRALGPFAVMMSTDEYSINTGETGHTVSKSETLSPASDSKIAKAAASLETRAWRNLEILLETLEGKIDAYPEWKNSAYFRNRHTSYFATAASFQDEGLVDIEYSRLVFEKLRQLIVSIEKSEIDFLLQDLSREVIDGNDNLLKYIRAYIGMRVAELHTSQTSRVQRSKNNNLEFKAIIRPLYEDPSQTKNYYATQAVFWKEKLISLLEDLGVDSSKGKMEWNNEDKRIFSSVV